MAVKNPGRKVISKSFDRFVPIRMSDKEGTENQFVLFLSMVRRQIGGFGQDAFSSQLERENIRMFFGS